MGTYSPPPTLNYNPRYRTRSVAPTCSERNVPYRPTPTQPAPLPVLKAIAMVASLAFAVILLGMVLTTVKDSGLLGSANATGSALSGQESRSGRLSTPVSQWKRGEMPYLYQIDEAWAQEPYAGATISTHGCGPTALSMAYIYLTGKTSLGPVEMSRFSEDHGFVDAGATSWSFMEEGAQKLGMRSRELPASSDVIMTQLRMGHPVIGCVGPGDFTTDGHFILLAGGDDPDAIEVRDPNSPERSKQRWDLDTIISQARNFWALSV